MGNFKNTTFKTVKKENSTKKVLNKMEGITLVALVITVIVMLILAGVSISALMGNEGLFARTASAADAYKQAVEKENTDIESLLNELDETLNELEKSKLKSIAELAKDGTLKVGDYIDYDAGVWEAKDLELINNSIKEYGGSLNGTTGTEEEENLVLGVNKDKPTVQGQFGGFEIGQSRNSNSTPYSTGERPRTSGWRIWNIDEDTGEVTIIHAGHSETYYHAKGKSVESINILRNRNCSMYENEYAVEKSAHFLKGWEAAEWYTKNCSKGEIYELESYDEDLDGDGNGDKSFYNLDKFVTSEEMPVIEVLEIGACYDFASAANEQSRFFVHVGNRHVSFSYNDAHGLRVLVSLKSDFKLELDTNKTEDGWNLWKIVKN